MKKQVLVVTTGKGFGGRKIAVYEAGFVDLNDISFAQQYYHQELEDFCCILSLKNGTTWHVKGKSLDYIGVDNVSD